MPYADCKIGGGLKFRPFYIPGKIVNLAFDSPDPYKTMPRKGTAASTAILSGINISAAGYETYEKQKESGNP